MALFGKQNKKEITNAYFIDEMNKRLLNISSDNYFIFFSKDNLEKEYKHYAKSFHPDIHQDEASKDIFIKLKEMYLKAKLDKKNNTWNDGRAKIIYVEKQEKFTNFEDIPNWKKYLYVLSRMIKENPFEFVYIVFMLLVVLAFLKYVFVILFF